MRDIGLANGHIGRTEEESPKFVTADDTLSHIERGCTGIDRELSGEGQFVGFAETSVIWRWLSNTKWVLGAECFERRALQGLSLNEQQWAQGNAAEVEGGVVSCKAV